MKICAIILLLVTTYVVAEPFLSCSYSLNRLNRDTYKCDLTINNPNGFNNFTEIGGVHLKNLTNGDVTELCIDPDSDSISTNVPTIICDTFPSLKWIELNFVGLTEIGDDDFASCSRIIRLRLNFNHIRSISEHAFNCLANLEVIDLNHNNLTTLTENVFVNQQKLTSLDLESNPFDDIPDGLLQPLEKLETFYITSISQMKREWFVNTQLKTLWVTDSAVTALPDSFVSLAKLETFIFVNNQLSRIQSRGFTGLTNLDVLYLDNNKLTELRADTFFGLGELTQLYIENNPIESINENAFRGLDSLSSLYLAGCQIRQIQPNHFQHLYRLTSLSLDRNKIEELPEGVFSTLQLQSIRLSDNRLKVLHRNSFGSLRNLDWFLANSNNIHAIDRAIIDGAIQLKTFFFANNSCASFDSRNFAFIRTLLLPELEECFDNYKTIADATTEGEYNEERATERNEESTSPVYQTYANTVGYQVDFGIKFTSRLTSYVFILQLLSFCALLVASLTIYLLIKRSANDRDLGYAVLQ